MESQAAFVLVAFLYLASPLATVQAVRYSGPPTLSEGQPWTIECTGHKQGETFNWTKNGQPLQIFSPTDLSVVTMLDKGTSTISAEHAKDIHEGFYRCIAGGNESFHLTVKSDTKIRVLPPKEWLTLDCDNRTAGDKTVEWQKEKIDVRTVFAGKEDNVKIYENGTLALYFKEKEPEVPVFGNYTCNTTSSGNATTRYRIVPRPIIKLGTSVSVVEGEKLLIVCSGLLMPGAKITWTFAGKTYNSSEGRVRLTRDEERKINRAILNVDNIEMSDGGNVTCSAAYDWADPDPDHRASATTLLRVKDKLAALWPFLGICAEVVVLCAIILIYEKKRNKAELEESDTDQSPDTTDLLKHRNSDSMYVPLRGPLPPSDLPVRPPVTPPRPSSPIYKTVQFHSPSREPRRDSPMRSAPPSSITVEPQADAEQGLGREAKKVNPRGRLNKHHGGMSSCDVYEAAL